MTTVPHYVSVTPRTARQPEPQAIDNYVLATRVVHRAETLLAAAEGIPEAIAHIEIAFAIALSITGESTWTEVRAARDHLDLAQEELELCAYWLR